MQTIAANPHDRLDQLGWEGEIREYQAFYGLMPDGVLGPVTSRSLAELRICPLPDRMNLGGQICKWGKHHLTWHFSGRLPGLDDDTAKESFRLATQYWQAVCDLRFTYVSQPNAADLLLTAGAIDNSGGTLAWQELPCGSDRQRQGKYDTRDTWTNAISPSRGRIDLVRVACHELGHGIGIEHLNAGNLLQPTYDTRIRKPQSGDIAEAQKRYGPPKNVPDPAEPKPPIPLPPVDGNGETDWSQWLEYVHIPARAGDFISIGPPGE